MKFKKLVCLLLVLFMSGCTTMSSGSSALYQGDYAAILPYEDSNTRVKHASLISDLDCRVQIESGLMDLSKDYFSPNEVEYKTQTFLDYYELDATDGSRGLLGTLRDSNPIGLNPSRDEEFDTGNGISTGPVILVDVYELDWYQGDTLKGVSVSLVLNGSLYLDTGSVVKIEPAKLNNYFDVTSNKLVAYMRERFNEITSHVPIFVCAYVLDDDAQLYGGYQRTGYFDGSQGSFVNTNEQWILIPSKKMTQLDPSLASEFNTFKGNIKNVLMDYTFVTGVAKYEGNQPTKVNITIEAHAKSTGEILAVGQMAKESLSTFTNEDCRYSITIKNNDITYIIIQRPENTTECNVVSTL